VVTWNRPPEPPVQSTVSRAVCVDSRPAASRRMTPCDIQLIVLHQADRANAFDDADVGGGMNGCDKRVHDGFTCKVPGHTSNARVGVGSFQ
jgi:hypothetical protein